MYPDSQVRVNVPDFLNSPSRVERVLRELTRDRTIADYAFGQGDANQGAVVYDVVTGHPVETDRDVAAIAPGGEFPRIGVLAEIPQTAKVDKYGGAAEMTREAIRRNETDTLAKRMRLLSNLVVKKVNAIAVQSLVTNPLVNTLTVVDPWVGANASATGDAIGSLFQAKALIDDNELGYEGNLALINPLDSQKYLLGVKAVRDQVTENTNNNPVLSGDLGRLANMEWIRSSQVPQGTIWIMERGVSGSVRDEEGGLRTDTFEDKNTQRTVIQAWRTIVPIITDPKSVTKLVGFDA